MVSTHTDTATRTKFRAVTAVAVVAASAIVFTVGRGLSGPLEVPQTGGRTPLEVTLPMVVFVSALAALLGWGSAAVLERLTRRGTKIWVGLAVVVVLASFAPLALSGIATETSIVLGLLHLLVGVLLIAGITHTSPHRHQPSRGVDPAPVGSHA